MDPLIEACGADPSFVCRQMFETFESATAARVVDFIITRPLKILVILLLAVVTIRLTRRAIRRVAAHLRSLASPDPTIGIARPLDLVATAETLARAEQRAEALSTVLRSSANVAVWGVALLLVLGEVGINLGPLIAGAGIVGVAIGFGSQALVRDFLAGLLMLVEDQYGVGDIAAIGDAVGTVEAISLRTTRLRALDGTVWHIPNGEIRLVGNMSQGWARVVLDVSVAYGSDLSRAMQVIKEAADQHWSDDREGAHRIIEAPEVWGVQDLGADGVAVRLVVKTRPNEQWGVGRELRHRIKDALDAAAIEIPFPQRVMWVRQDEPAPKAETAS